MRLPTIRVAAWLLVLSALWAGGPSTAGQAKPLPAGGPVQSLLEMGQGRLLWIYDGIRHVELPLPEGRAVIGLNCERQTWTLFSIQRNNKEAYSFRQDPNWSYLPAGPIASSRFCKESVRVAD